MVSVEVLQSGIADHNLHRGQRARRGAQLENEERAKDQRYAACGLWFFRTVGSQFGLININLGKSSDPVLEEQILNDVGSYGRQIGQIGDALRVLVDHVKLDGLKPEEERALKALRYQLDEVDRLKSKRDQVRAVGAE